MKITVDGVQHDVDVEADMPLLWVLRDELNVKGVKYGAASRPAGPVRCILMVLLCDPAKHPLGMWMAP